ncbi:MAG: hypothetical protein JWO67_5456 [Streptosporangiaceae bacterium]|nr:hypothetical protein [Streptosporangiaceae bacterium]
MLQEYGVALTPQEMITIGPRICGRLRESHSVETVIAEVMSGEPQLDYTHASYTAGGGVGMYCREFAYKVKAADICARSLEDLRPHRGDFDHLRVHVSVVDTAAAAEDVPTAGSGASNLEGTH